MNEFLQTQMQKLGCGQPPSRNEYYKLISEIDFPIDSTFLEWIEVCSQAEGPMSSRTYIQFWKIDDILTLNPYYKDLEAANRLFFFGSDGSSLGYAFDKENGNVVAIDFIDIGIADPVILGGSFVEFMENLARE